CTMGHTMQLDEMLERCRRLEERVAAVYRTWAASAPQDPALCELWTALAREEEQHAQSIARARSHLRPTAGWRTRLDGWGEALACGQSPLRSFERWAARAARLSGVVHIPAVAAASAGVSSRTRASTSPRSAALVCA